MAMCRQPQLTQEHHKITEAHYDAEVLASGRRAHIVDSAHEPTKYRQKIVKDLMIGEKDRVVDVRQFVSEVAWSLRGKIERDHQAHFTGIIMPESVDDAMLIVMDIHRSP